MKDLDEFNENYNEDEMAEDKNENGNLKKTVKWYIW